MNKYQIIHDELLKEINDGKYPNNAMLPSDFALMNRYHVARETSRKAVAMLVDEGYVMRIKGRGTFVINQNRYSFPISHVESYRELAARLKLNERTQLLTITDSEVPSVFEYGDDTPVPATAVVRIRYLDNEPVIIDHDYVLKDVVPEIKKLSQSVSLFELFEQQLGLVISYAKKTITVEPANATDRQLMGLAESIPIVVIRSETFLNDGRIISFTESRHRADRFKSVEFSRRH
ncbi:MULTISPECIES: trehalose operon repressor [Leuconostoc]|uniref:Trehalose operon repressor n=2 Tax=Leuconostoc TaxID=1243 RepID=A0A5B8T495_LEUPS|nr:MULTISPECIES: trehalose operon repressor [Leuconostoc]MCC8438831.1 trehalose operon repressor [Leuconostoc pseudomesenteroides]MDG9732684.1 trehalose operon repressor [Leuconostoc pseudomesenteroides]MDN2450406.1 trehalose operon repressor [Leuconostoc sp. UCMA20149]NKZ35485.1 trehalose operon repressor [Leuconostoc pseudomesenteroides]QEA41883.1 trehalose operon repressor [Leuconostoc pseudomesenteroides]